MRPTKEERALIKKQRDSKRNKNLSVAQKAAKAAYNRNWTKVNRIYATKRQNEWRAANPDKVAKHNAEKRKHVTFNRYGITREQKTELFESQGCRCALCATTAFDRLGPVVDHDHSTGRVRGILCSRCNIWLSAIEKGKVSLSQVARYLGEAE